MRNAKKEVERARCTCIMSSCCQREIDAANSPPAFATPAPPRSRSVAPITPTCLPPTRPSRSGRCSSAARERHAVGSLEPARTRAAFAHRDTQTHRHTMLRHATHILRVGIANCSPTVRDDAWHTRMRMSEREPLLSQPSAGMMGNARETAKNFQSARCQSFPVPAPSE